LVSRLTEQYSGGRFGGAFFLGDYRKDDQEVQIDLTQFLYTHIGYDHYA
jgi:hypothetical protein